MQDAKMIKNACNSSLCSVYVMHFNHKLRPGNACNAIFLQVRIAQLSLTSVCVCVCDTHRDKKGEKFIFSKCWCRCCVSALKLGICSKACIEVGMHLMTLTVVILTMMMTAVVILTMMKMVIRTMMVPPVPTVSCMCSTHSAGLCRGMLSGETESSKKGKVKAGQLFALVKQSKF